METIFLKWLLNHIPEERPTSQDLLQDPFVPAKTRDSYLDEVLKSTLTLRALPYEEGLFYFETFV